MSTAVFESKSKPPIANSKCIKPFLNVLFKLPRNLFEVGTSANITNPKINVESVDSIAKDVEHLLLKKLPAKIMWLKKDSKEKKKNKLPLSSSDFEHVQAFIVNFGGDRPNLLLECEDLNRSAQQKHITARKRLRMEDLDDHLFSESEEEDDLEDIESQTLKRLLEADPSEQDGENSNRMGFQENEDLIQDIDILNDRLTILEKDKQDLSVLLSAKDNEILKLQEMVAKMKDDNPNFLITDTIATLKNVLEAEKNVSTSVAGHPKNVEENLRTPNSKKMVYLCKNTPLLKLDSTNLKSALISGKISPNVENRRAMVNKLLDAVYTRAHMAAHTVSGKCSPMSKKMKSTESPKPMLPAEEVQQIAFFVIKFWRAEHNLDIDEQDIKDCIRRKLATEHRRYQLLIQKNIPEEDQQDQDISAIRPIPSTPE